MPAKHVDITQFGEILICSIILYNSMIVHIFQWNVAEYITPSNFGNFPKKKPLHCHSLYIFPLSGIQMENSPIFFVCFPFTVFNFTCYISCSGKTGVLLRFLTRANWYIVCYKNLNILFALFSSISFSNIGFCANRDNYWLNSLGYSCILIECAMIAQNQRHINSSPQKILNLKVKTCFNGLLIDLYKKHHHWTDTKKRINIYSIQFSGVTI